jgi:hypothetical protein
MDMALVIYVWIHGNLSKPNNVVQIKSQQRNFLTSEKRGTWRTINKEWNEL